MAVAVDERREGEGPFCSPRFIPPLY